MSKKKDCRTQTTQKNLKSHPNYSKKYEVAPIFGESHSFKIFGTECRTLEKSPVTPLHAGKNKRWKLKEGKVKGTNQQLKDTTEKKG